jgi:uncharacterized membrane protein YqgA involved in biofilm formation
VWSILSGTIVNAITVLVGSVLGATVAARLPERFRIIVLTCLGLITVTLGIDASVLRFANLVGANAPRMADSGTYGARLAMVMIASLILGSLLGSLLRLHDRIEGLGGLIHRRFSRPVAPTAEGSPPPDDGSARFAHGFLSASVIFCVGPLTLLGCLRNGAYGDPSYLYIKACLDGFCSMALAAAFGWGVLASVVSVLGLQGGLALLAYYFAEPLAPVSLELMNSAGGVVLLATSLMILDLKRVPVADMCPAIFLPPLIVWVVELISPGLLLPVS